MSAVMKRKGRVGFRIPGFRLYLLQTITHDLSQSLAPLVFGCLSVDGRIRIIALQKLVHCNHLLVQGLEPFVTIKVSEATRTRRGEMAR